MSDQAYDDAPAEAVSVVLWPLQMVTVPDGEIVGAGGQTALTVTEAEPVSFAELLSFEADTVAEMVSVPADAGVMFALTGAVLDAASDEAEQEIVVAVLVHEVQGAVQVMLLTEPPLTVAFHVAEVEAPPPAFVAPRVTLKGVPATAVAGTLANDGVRSAAAAVEMVAETPVASPE